ncbi:MAG: hypothetical protein EOP85_14845 [Verrucomicrobiaceae bacterium]|nr:MAG: hypothetical protein EOP85_14845 [Verrucomicrobiaceae bacterium]
MANQPEAMDLTSISQMLILGPPCAAGAAVAIAMLRYWYKLRAPGVYVDAMNRACGKAQRDAVVRMFCETNCRAERGTRERKETEKAVDAQGTKDKKK